MNQMSSVPPHLPPRPLPPPLPAGVSFSGDRGEFRRLVTRGAAQEITFSRSSFTDRFYVRMYDGAVPPNYSEFSSAVFVNLPWSE